MKHLLSIADLARDDIERHPRARRELRRGRPPRHQEGADPPRAHHRQPLHGGEHADELLVRARREAPLGRRRLAEGSRIVRREGRVAQGHDRDAFRLWPRGDRHPVPRGRAPPALVAQWTEAAVVNAGDGKHEHPTPGAPRPPARCAGGSARSRVSGSGSSATSFTVASPAPGSSRSARWAPR